MNRTLATIAVTVLVLLSAPGLAMADEDGEDIDIGDIVETNDEADEPEEIERSIDNTAWIKSVEFRDDGTAEIVVVTERELRMTVTDSGSIDPNQPSGTFWQETYNLPADGEYRLVVSAEERENTQLITIVGNFNDNIYFSDKGSTFSLPIDGPFSPSEAQWIGAVGAATGAIVVVLLIWRRRRINSSEVNEV